MSTHIKSIRLRNVRKITVAECEFIPERGLVRITGPNASGKTSLLREVAGLICGASAVLPDAVQDGHDEGVSELVLSDGLTITRTYNETYPKGYLNVVGEDGGTHKQAKLNGLIGPRTFDPFPFLDLKPAKMREALLSVATDPDLPKKLDKLKAKSEGIYQKRTPFIVKERADRAVPRPQGDRPEPVDVREAQANLQALQAQQAIKDKLLNDATGYTADMDFHGQKINDAQALKEHSALLQSITKELRGIKINDAKLKNAVERYVKALDGLAMGYEKASSGQAKLGEGDFDGAGIDSAKGSSSLLVHGTIVNSFRRRIADECNRP